ncbi:MAG: ParB N-terminal domain-containing protein [Kiloniellaceae bacterium]
MVVERGLESVQLPIAEIYVPAKRRATLNQAQVDALAESIMAEGLQRPIAVRKGNGRYVLQEGLHRLEACRALGEETIACMIVRARQH